MKFRVRGENNILDFIRKRNITKPKNVQILNILRTHQLSETYALLLVVENQLMNNLVDKCLKIYQSPFDNKSMQDELEKGIKAM